MGKNSRWPKMLVYCLPYFGHVSDNFKKRLRRLTKPFKVNLQIAFKTFKIGQYFSLKDKTPIALKSKCVYQFTCPGDLRQTYIGKTKRHLAIRCKEHLKGNSAIFEHVSKCPHCKGGSLDSFKILNNGNSDLEIKILEVLQIKKCKPTLNN